MFVDAPVASLAPVAGGLLGGAGGSIILFAGAFTFSNCCRNSICSAVIKFRFATLPRAPPPFILFIGPNKKFAMLFYPVLPNANFLPFKALTLSITGSLLSPNVNL